MKPVRVAAVIDSLGGGGAEMALAEMLPGLRDRGIDVSVVCLHRRDVGVENKVLATGADVTWLAEGALPRRVRELRRFLQRTRPDIVHTTLFQASLVGRIAARGLGIPVLTSVVNDGYGTARYADPAISVWRLRVVQQVDGWTTRHLTNHVHAITEVVAGAAVDQLGVDPESITVIGRGHDPARLAIGADRRSRVRAALGIGERAPVVLAVGRHEYQKGLQHLVDAAASLRDRHDGFVVLIAGREGNTTAALRDQISRLGLERVVRLLGYRDDIPDLLSAADVFAFPSLFEGLGNALIEAMGMGRPIVASDLDVVREVVGGIDGGAVLTPPGDADALAHAIGDLLDDSKRGRGLGAKNRNRFISRFLLEDVLDAMAVLYRQLAKTDQATVHAAARTANDDISPQDNQEQP